MRLHVICPSVTIRYRDGIGWNSSKTISPPNSDEIVMSRFLRNRRLILRLHTIFRALIYRAHRAVVFAIACFLVLNAPTLLNLFLIHPEYTLCPWIDLRGSSATSFQFIFVTDCQPTVYRRWPSFSGRHCSCLEQSAWSCHVCTFRSCLPVSAQNPPV